MIYSNDLNDYSVVSLNGKYRVVYKIGNVVFMDDDNCKDINHLLDEGLISVEKLFSWMGRPLEQAHEQRQLVH